MRNAMLQLCLVVIGVTSIHAVKLLQTSSFHVRLLPARGVGKVWAIQGSDSVEMTNVNDEYYLRSINPGHWQVLVLPKEPYCTARLEVTDMKPGTDRDLGEIRLQTRAEGITVRDDVLHRAR
ncbi:hypothetical protein [Puia sp.]|uniref:hypothetical protein n=1 Tax=Puia sp. TaxID=2045100 RepID=UPI002F41CC1D